MAEYNKILEIIFIGYEIAFNSVSPKAVMKALENQGIEKTYPLLLDDIYKECTGRITLHKRCDKFPIQKGVRQGDTNSPKLFTCLESVSRRLHGENLGLRINGEYFSCLRVADVIVLLSESVEQLQNMIEELQSEIFAVGLKIND